MNLTLDAGVVSSKPGEGVHVRSDLLVHEPDNIPFAVLSSFPVNIHCSTSVS